MAVSLEALAGFLEALPAPITVALESCLYWQWLHDQLERLHTIPGVGLFGALFLVAEIGAIERFPRVIASPRTRASTLTSVRRSLHTA